MLIIPTDINQENYSIDVTLDEVTYTLGFIWNKRIEKWFMSMSTADGTPLLLGQKLVAGERVGSWLASEESPAGILYVFDSSGSDSDPGLTDLGETARCQLLYITLEEWNEFVDDPDGYIASL